MRITLAVALVALLSSSVLAQESIPVETEANIDSPAAAIDSFTEVAEDVVTMGEVTSGEVTSGSVVESEIYNSVEPVLYQEGILVEGAVEGVVDAVPGVTEGAVQDAMVAEPSSVISGEVIQSDPIYTQGAPMVEGSVVTDGGAVMSGQPVVSTPSCGCGTSGAAPAMTYSSDPAPVMTYSSDPAPVMTYSSAPVQYSAPASNPCCNQPRRGFFRSLFGN